MNWQNGKASGMAYVEIGVGATPAGFLACSLARSLACVHLCVRDASMPWTTPVLAASLAIGFGVVAGARRRY